ncbi:MAG: creatininase [Verrucomicrobia bacterium]|nr:MAG: creatininase [Verrucomicrobiota bacterium]
MPSRDSSDPLGHALLRSRLAAIPEILAELLRTPLPTPAERTLDAQRFVVTGTGSSEAHARYLVHLLNRAADRAAEYIPLSGFGSLPHRFGRGRVLVVVSQGLSPNAQVAIDRSGDFDHTILFTSTTAEGAAAAGKHARAQLVRRLEKAGVEFIRSPLEEEYSTLLRVVGPMAVYATMHRFVRTLAPESLPPLTPATLAPLLTARPDEALHDVFAERADAFRRGFYLLAASPLCEYAQNLAYKFLEGVFWSAPVIWDYLQFAHGPFQEVTLQPRPVVMLVTPGELDSELAERTRAVLDAAEVPHIAIASRSRSPLAIFEYEAIFNEIVMRLIERFDIDQRNWPSKGRDDPLYGFARID